MQAREFQGRLLTAVSKYSEDEQTVLLLLAERLNKGRGPYGALKLANDKRDFVRETIEEVADQSLYAGMELVKLQRHALSVVPPSWSWWERLRRWMNGYDFVQVRKSGSSPRR